MPAVRDADEHRRVRIFLSRKSLESYCRLERINPWYTWVLRHFYGTVRTSIQELCRLSGQNQVFVNSRRLEALHLLGWAANIARKRQTTANYLQADFLTRSRLAFLRENAELGRGDLEILGYVLHFGPSVLEISRGTDWTEAEAKWALKRFLSWDQREVLQPGEHVRRLTLEELRDKGENRKAALELRILEGLSSGVGLVELATEWQVAQSVISAITTEIRAEISRHAATKAGYRTLERTGREEGRRGTYLVKWLNSNLLPLYRRFRESATPFSGRERRYLAQRIRGVGVTVAGQKILGITYPPASVIDRAFIEPLRRPPFRFPKVLPLPPFTEKQERLMERLQYARVS